MFEVRLTYEMGGDWQEVDDAIETAAGRLSEWAGAGVSGRDHGWHAPSFDDALALKVQLEAVPGVRVTIRETITY